MTQKLDWSLKLQKKLLESGLFEWSKISMTVKHHIHFIDFCCPQFVLSLLFTSFIGVWLTVRKRKRTPRLIQTQQRKMKCSKTLGRRLSWYRNKVVPVVKVMTKHCFISHCGVIFKIEHVELKFNHSSESLLHWKTTHRTSQILLSYIRLQST